MKHKFLLIIALTLVCGMVGCTPTNTTNSTSVSTPNTQPTQSEITYTLSNKTADVTLEVTGNSDIPTTFMESNHLKEENIGTIYIQDGITGIDTKAFYQCYFDIVFMHNCNSLVSIGDYAFTHCTMQTITLPDKGVKYIGEGAFQYCHQITSFSIPDGVTAVNDYTFYDCIRLKSIDIPDSVTSIGNCAFDGCFNLKNVDIPDGVTSIGKEAFGYCTNLDDVSIPDSVTIIDDDAFKDCPHLTIHCSKGSYAESYAIEHDITTMTSLSNNDKP